MKFEPKTELECANLLPRGVCFFEVTNAKDTSSKNGNDMMVLTLSVTGDVDQNKTITDYLVGQVDSMAYKIRHFADAIGMLAEYESGELSAENVVGSTGQCKVDIDDRDPAYPPKNVIRDYVKREAEVGPKRAQSAPSKPDVKSAVKSAPKKKAMADTSDMDDDIPF